MGTATPRGPVPVWWTARYGFAPPSRHTRWTDYVATLLRVRGLDDKVIHPHGLGDRRSHSDERRYKELVELHRRVDPGPEQHVLVVDQELPIKPVLGDAVQLPLPALNRIELEIGLDVMPVVLVSRTRSRLERGLGRMPLFVVPPRGTGLIAVRRIAVRVPVATTGSAILGDL